MAFATEMEIIVGWSPTLPLPHFAQKFGHFRVGGDSLRSSILTENPDSSDETMVP
jgi:hypothetical protein